jgi:hypothetical protein
VEVKTQIEPTLTKETTDRVGVITAYRVNVGKQFVGYVWKRRGFCYRGMQGRNRDIRIRDYHPIEWRYGKYLGVWDGSAYYSRGDAVAAMIEAGESR